VSTMTWGDFKNSVRLLTLQNIWKWVGEHPESLHLGWLPFVLGVVYAQPWVLGVALAVAGITIFIVARVKTLPLNAKVYGSAVFALLLGISVCACNQWETQALLKLVYGRSLLPVSRINGRLGPPLKEPTKELWPVAIRLGEDTLHFHPDTQTAYATDFRRLLQFDPAKHTGKVIFLLGTAGSGKTPLAERWGRFCRDVGPWDAVFNINLREVMDHNPGQQSDGVQWYNLASLLQTRYHKTVDDPKYFELLLENLCCLVFVDALDELREPGYVDSVLKGVSDVVSTTQTTLIVTCRPDVLAQSDIWRREGFVGKGEFAIAWIQPLNGSNFRFFLDESMDYLAQQKHVIFPNRDRLAQFVRDRRESDQVIRDLSSELDHLQELLLYYNGRNLDTVASATLLEHMVNSRITRNRKTHPFVWTTGKTDQALCEAAFKMSTQDSLEIQDEELRYSGFTAVEPTKGTCWFQPPIFQSYFAIKELKKRLKQNPPYTSPLSQRLLEDAWLVANDDSEVRSYVKRSFEQKPLEYEGRFPEVAKLLGVDFVLAVLKKQNPEKLAALLTSSRTAAFRP
jgi:hypothetical protein